MLRKVKFSQVRIGQSFYYAGIAYKKTGEFKGEHIYDKYEIHFDKDCEVEV